MDATKRESLRSRLMRVDPAEGQPPEAKPEPPQTKDSSTSKVPQKPPPIPISLGDLAAQAKTVTVAPTAANADVPADTAEQIALPLEKGKPAQLATATAPPKPPPSAGESSVEENVKPANPAKFPSHNPPDVKGAKPDPYLGDKTSPGPGRNPDLRVSVKLGATIPMGDYKNVRPEIELVGVDPYGDIEGQVKAGLEAAVVGFVQINQTLRVLIDEKLDVDTSGVSYEDRIAALERFVELAKGNINKLGTMIKTHNHEDLYGHSAAQTTP